MIEYKAYACEIASRVNGRLSGDDCLIEAISIDTRENVERPFCYFAIRGENYDGHNFIEEAINNGAVLIIAEKKIDVDASVIYVENTVKALGYLAKNTKRMAKIIGITGSVGKTTTKDLIISVLKQKYNVTGTKYNYNNEIGVALTLLSIKNEEICVLEMGARGKGDIKWLTYISQPEIAIITNCGKSHIEYFGSEREIFNEKIEILNENCNAIVVPNEKRFKEYEFKNTYPIFVGANGDFYFDKVRLKKSGTSGYICSKGKMILKIESKTVSKRVFENSLFAYVVGKLCSLSDSQIKRGIKSYDGTELRLEMIRIKTNTLINDTYNASYESVLSSIDTLTEWSKIENKQPICVLGDMLELGNFSRECHYKIGQYCKERKVCEVYTLGKFGKDILRGYGSGNDCQTKESLTELLKNKNNCVILFKASRKMGFEKIVEEIKDKLNE